MTRALLLAAATFFSVSCGASLLKLPAGPGAPASDGAAVIAQATAFCRALSTVTAEISVRGSVRGRRVRGRLVAGFGQPDSTRLEAAAPLGQPLFVFASNGRDATVLLPRDRRALAHGDTADVLEAVTGVALDGTPLRAVLTACPLNPEAATAQQRGDLWRVITDGRSDIWMHRNVATGPWRVAVMTHATQDGGWRAEYRDFMNGSPLAIRLTSAADRDTPFDLQLALSQVEVNVPLGPEAFRIQMPTGVTPIGLDELRQSGPLGEK